MNLIALNSDRWEELSYNGVSGELPDTLIKFLDTASSFAEKTKALDTINDQIFHQTSTYEATFVVLPILIANCPAQHIQHQFWICQLIGLVSLQQGDYPSGLTRLEIESYEESRKIGCDISTALLKSGIEKDSERAIYLTKFILALSGERDLAWRLDNRTEEDPHRCPHCDRRFESVSYCIRHASVDDPNEYLNLQPENLYATPIHRTVEGQPVISRSSFPEGSKEGWITNLCEQNGHPKCGQWLRNFFGSTQCPACRGLVELLGGGIPC